MSDNGSTLSRRSSSQTSRASADSKKNKTVRKAPKRAGSKVSTSSIADADPALTSFPSFSPEPETRPKAQEPPSAKVARTISQKARDRRATLAGLTGAPPAFDKTDALFDDSPRSSLDIPGALHLANDSQFERLIAKTGAVRLLRQYAKDLAQRDAEMSALRVRADNRERELKKLLREANIPSADIEKRLLRLEQGDANQNRNSATSIDGLMNEAIGTDLALSPVQTANEVGNVVSTVPDSRSLHSRKSSIRDATLKSNTIASRGSSRANSILSEGSQDLDATLRPRVPSSSGNKTSSLQNIFSPPGQGQAASYFIGGAKTLKRPKAADEVSVRSAQSGKSFASWTQIFGGKSSNGRARASSLEQEQANPKASEAESALAKLSKIKTNPQPISASSNTLKQKSSGRQTPTTTRLSSSPSHARKDSNASNLPLTVEMDSVLEPDTLPPTMSTKTINTNGLLTDRYGFIYDQRRRKRETLQVPKHKRNKFSGSGGFRKTDGSPSRGHERSSTPVSVDDDGSKKSWQDYLKPVVSAYAVRPKQLLSHTPSAGAVVTVSTADASGTITPPRPRDVSASASVTGLDLMPSSAHMSEPQSSLVTATSAEVEALSDADLSIESASSKLLLDHLNDLHDSLQAERLTKWNDFLRRVRAERASSADPSSRNVPEADILEGELIGIATLGRSSKQKAKYTHFKTLVLMGIPVTLRPKVWAECSGATARRVPGYYEDLIIRSDDDAEIDPDIASQINADIRRTLTDNVFFHDPQPGVRRLEEVLRAYSLHNPSIGYCQGMNLICGSLLLICATPEDCFWLLVAIIDTILPSGYFSGSLLTARAPSRATRIRDATAAQPVREARGPRCRTGCDHLPLVLVIICWRAHRWRSPV